jgi:tetratricopeptide (TPR) repeat protein
VSKKYKFKGHDKALPLPVLKGRVERALEEGRFQHGLDLARSLAKQDPSEAAQELLRKATLGRGRQLRESGHTRDAAVVLDCAARLGGGAYLAEVAQELAACGEVSRALGLAEQVEDPALRTRILARAADGAVAQGPAGRALLPESLQAAFDLIVRAFDLIEAGQDEPAREALQGIGLQSPFLEWKLLLRGLIAYNQNGDARAVENWQRLTPDRLPAHLAAPFRFLIDKAFRAAQPPATQTALQRQADRFQSSGLVPALRAIQAALSNERQLAQAFRQAETLLDTLRREAPALVPRLAACFYWAIIHHGQPEDVRRYQRVFGAPADDPHLDRLQALAVEQRGMMAEAHGFWQQFEKGVAANAAAWPPGQADRARALVWWHMGHNADEMPEADELPDFPPFLGERFRKPRPLKPTAEECYQRSLELAPDQLEPYTALLRHHLKKEQRGKAEKAARKLLKQFPDNAPTREILGDLRMQAQDYAEAIACFEQALRGNPLERRLRAKLSTAHMFHARAHAEDGRFDEARAEYQAALYLNEGGETYSVLCKWAACEFKAGDDARARELLGQALAQADSGLAVAFSMLIEAIRLKLPRPLKTMFDQDVARQLAEPPGAAAAAALARTVAAHRKAGVTYFGQKTHEKKVLTYLEKARGQTFTEQQLMDVCTCLREVDRVRLLRDYARRGQEQFPESPFFYLVEAEMNLDMDPYRCPVYETRELLQRARERALALPRDERQQAVLEQIKEMEDDLRAMNPFASVLAGMPFDPFDPFGGEEFDEDDGP